MISATKKVKLVSANKKVIYKCDIGHWRSDHSYFKSYSGQYKGDLGQMKWSWLLKQSSQPLKKLSQFFFLKYWTRSYCFSNSLDKSYAILIVFTMPQNLGVEIFSFSVINDSPIERNMVALFYILFFSKTHQITFKIFTVFIDPQNMSVEL